MNTLYFVCLELVVRQLSRVLFRSSELEAIVLGVCEGVFLTVTAREEHRKSSSSIYLPVLLTFSAALDAFFFARLEATIAHVLGGVLGVVLAEYGPSILEDAWEYDEDRYSTRSRSGSPRRHGRHERIRSEDLSSVDASMSRGRSTTQRTTYTDPRRSRAATLSTSTPVTSVPLHPPTPRESSSRRRDVLPPLTVDTAVAHSRRSTVTDRVTSTRTARFSSASPSILVPQLRTPVTSIAIPAPPTLHPVPGSNSSAEMRSPIIQSPSTSSNWSRSFVESTPVSHPQQRQQPVQQQQRQRASTVSSGTMHNYNRAPESRHSRRSYVEDESAGERTPRTGGRSVSAPRKLSKSPARNSVKPLVSSDEVWVKVESPAVPQAPPLGPSLSAGSAVSATHSNSGRRSPMEKLSRLANRISGIFNQDIGDISFSPGGSEKKKSPVSPNKATPMSERPLSSASIGAPRMSFAPSQNGTHIAPSPMQTNDFFGQPPSARENFFDPSSPARNRLATPTRDRPLSAARNRPSSRSPSRPLSQAPSRPVSQAYTTELPRPPSQAYSRPITPTRSRSPSPRPSMTPNVAERPPSRPASWVVQDFGEATQFSFVETSYNHDHSPGASPRSAHSGLPVPGPNATGSPAAAPTKLTVPAAATMTAELLSASEISPEESTITVIAYKEAALNRARELRRMAEEAMNRREKLEQGRARAYRNRQFGKAFALKCQRDEAEAEAARLHRRAARRFQQANNANFKTLEESTLDVHGLKKNEAIACVERRLRELQLAGERKLRVIVGKGNHSKHGVAVLKPAVLNAMQKQGLQASVDMRNAGVIHIQIHN